MKYITKGQTQTGLYEAMRERSKALGDSRDCTVKAVAVVCGLTYDEAQLLMSKHGRVKGGGAYTPDIHKAVESLGFSVSYEPIFKEERLQFLAKNGYVVKHLTTRQLAMFPELARGGTFLLYTSGHVAALKDGVVHCWGALRPLRITSAYRVC